MLYKLARIDGKECVLNFITRITQSADPMTFPLLFPHDDVGWTFNMCQIKDKNITPLQYFGQRLALLKNYFNPLLNSVFLIHFKLAYFKNCYFF